MAEVEITGLDTVEQSALAKFDPYVAEAAELGAKASAAVITNDKELAAANEIKKSLNAFSKNVKETRLSLSRPFDAVKDLLIGRERQLLEPVEAGKKTLGDNILAYEEELERRRRAEEERVDGIVARVDGLYRAGMTRTQVDSSRTAAKALIAELGKDGEIPRVKLALVNLSNRFAERTRDLDIEDARAKKQKLESEQAKIDEEKRQLEARKQAQEAEKAQLEADKAAAKAERERPKSNIVEVYEFEILDPNGVDRAYCSPDDKKIRAFIADHKQEIDNGAMLAGIRIFKTKKVR